MRISDWSSDVCSSDLTCGLKARASMLAPASRPRRAAVVDLLAPDAALTDPDPAARPAPNENHLLINAYSTHPPSPLLPVTRRTSDSGCNLADTRLSTVGRDVSVTALATGSWDSAATLEAMLTRLEREDGLKLIWSRQMGKGSCREWGCQYVEIRGVGG